MNLLRFFVSHRAIDRLSRARIPQAVKSRLLDKIWRPASSNPGTEEADEYLYSRILRYAMVRDLPLTFEPVLVRYRREEETRVDMDMELESMERLVWYRGITKPSRNPWEPRVCKGSVWPLPPWLGKEGNVEWH